MRRSKADKKKRIAFSKELRRNKDVIRKKRKESLEKMKKWKYLPVELWTEERKKYLAN